MLIMVYLTDVIVYFILRINEKNLHPPHERQIHKTHLVTLTQHGNNV